MNKVAAVVILPFLSACTSVGTRTVGFRQGELLSTSAAIEKSQRTETRLEHTGPAPDDPKLIVRAFDDIYSVRQSEKTFKKIAEVQKIRKCTSAYYERDCTVDVALVIALHILVVGFLYDLVAPFVSEKSVVLGTDLQPTADTMKEAVTTEEKLSSTPSNEGVVRLSFAGKPGRSRDPDVSMEENIEHGKATFDLKKILFARVWSPSQFKVSFRNATDVVEVDRSAFQAKWESSPVAALVKACEDHQTLQDAKSEIESENQIGRTTGVVDKVRLHRAGKTIEVVTPFFERHKVDYRQKSGKAWSLSDCQKVR